MIDKSVLMGYVLEELLASLVSASGYNLLVNAAQDPDALITKSNGLCVRGRGAVHQVDVLGEIAIPVQLTYPLRLFLEAKCRGGSSGLRDVRNAVGTVDDVNQYYNPALAASWTKPYQRFEYKYALASTSGFSSEAIDYAITHQLSLIDLSTEASRWLREAVGRIADALLAQAALDGLTSFPVGQMREAMRMALGTWPGVETSPDQDTFAASSRRAAAVARPAAGGLASDGLAAICAGVRETLDGRIYVAWTTTPFLLFVLPDDAQEGDSFIDEAPGRPVPSKLMFVGPEISSGEWILEPEGSRRSRFRFTIPPAMEPFLFGEGNMQRTQTSYDSQTSREPIRQTVTVQVRAGQTVDLEFEAVPVEPSTSSTASNDLGETRERRWLDLRRRAWTGGREPTVNNASEDYNLEDNPERVKWTSAAYDQLLQRLREENWPHARVIEAAARQNGEITRADVYRVARYPDDRTLRGFTRPCARIAQDLVDEGILDEGASWPLQTIYRIGVRASHFAVPPEFGLFVLEER